MDYFLKTEINSIPRSRSQDLLVIFLILSGALIWQMTKIKMVHQKITTGVGKMEKRIRDSSQSPRSRKF